MRLERNWETISSPWELSERCDHTWSQALELLSEWAVECHSMTAYAISTMHARHELKAPIERETNVATNRAQKIFCQRYDEDVSNPGGEKKRGTRNNKITRDNIVRKCFYSPQRHVLLTIYWYWDSFESNAKKLRKSLADLPVNLIREWTCASIKSQEKCVHERASDSTVN